MHSSKHTKYQAGMVMPVVIIVIVGLVGLGVGGYFFFSRSTVDQVTEKEVRPAPLDYEAVIGKEVKLATFSVVVKGIEEERTIRNGYPFTPGEAAGIIKAALKTKFVLAKLDVNNISGSAIVVLSDRFILRDDSGQEYKTLDHESELLRGFNYYMDKTELEVRGGVLGFIAFEVPENVASYQLLIREEAAAKPVVPSAKKPVQPEAPLSPLVGIWKPVKSYTALMGQEWTEIKPKTPEDKTKIEKEYMRFTKDGQTCTGEPRGSEFECKRGEAAYKITGNILNMGDTPAGQRIKWSVEGNTLELIVEGQNSDGLWVPFIKLVLTRYR